MRTFVNSMYHNCQHKWNNLTKKIKMQTIWINIREENILLESIKMIFIRAKNQMQKMSFNTMTGISVTKID